MIRNYIYYFIGIMLSRLAALILLPVYTSYLTPADYGVLELLSMIVVVGNLIFGCRITQSFFREFGLAKSDDERRLAFGSALGTSFVVSLVGVILIAGLSKWIGQLQFGTTDYTYYVCLFALNLSFGILQEVPMAYLRAKEQAKKYLFFSTLMLCIQISCNLIALAGLKAGLHGVVHASVASYLIFAIAINLGVTLPAKPKYSLQQAIKMVSFSFPIIFAGICMYFVVYGDRYFIRVYNGITEVGIYSLAYKFGLILSAIVWSPFNNTWDSEKYVIYRNESLHSYYLIIFNAILTIMAFAGLGLALWVGEFLRHTSNASYWSAEFIVPFVALAYVLFSVTDFFTFSIFLKERTRHMLYAAIVSCVSALIAYWLLVPKYAGVGAAIATVIAFGTRLLYVYVVSIRLYDLQVRAQHFLWPILAASLIYIAFIKLPISSQSLINVLFYTLVLGIVFILFMIPSYKSLKNYLAIRKTLS